MAKNTADTFRQAAYDIATRAGRTFVQALTAQLTVDAIIGGDVTTARAALVAAAAAGLSVIWRSLEAWANEL